MVVGKKKIRGGRKEEQEESHNIETQKDTAAPCSFPEEDAAHCT